MSGRPLLTYLLQTEAATARRRILEGQDTSTAQVHEAAWAREVLRIYQDARPETKAVYQFGHDLQTGDNWIIRWVMWHVFRYRDYRNKGRPSRNAATASLSPSTTDEEEHDPAPTNGASPVSSSANGVPGGDVAAAVRAAGEARKLRLWLPADV